MSASVQVDTSQLERGMRQLASGIAQNLPASARRQAEDCAQQIRGHVAVLTGRLRSTVATRPVTGGYAVQYGGGLRYSGYSERRTHAVTDAVDQAGPQWQRTAKSVVAREISRL